jgi:peptidyl-prolyl cis-trans isomerase D
MLKQLRRFEATQRYVIFGFIALMAVSLVIFYKPGGSSASLSPATSTEAVAKVNGDDITVAQLTQIKNRYQQYLGAQLAMAGITDKRLVDNLIHDRIVSQEAARLGLSATDAEVRDVIVKQFTDEKGKFVGLDRYRETVDANSGGVQNYEQGIRDAISAQKLRAFVTAGINVSEQEVQDDYKRKNTSFDLVYVPVTVDKLAAKINPSEDELRAYYDQHKTDYNILEPQKKIKYVFIDQAKAGEKLQISDEDLKAEYEKLSPENKQAGVKAQEIVLKVARKDLDSTVQSKAQELVTKLRGQNGGNVTEEAFAEAAKGNSENPATAKNGGQLNGVVKKNANRPDDPYQKVLDMPEGTITEPIKYGNSYYILRRGASVPKTFDDAKPELLVSLRNRRAYSVAAKLAEQAQQELKQTKDPQKVAQDLASQANMSPADMVRETPYVKPGDDVPNIGSSQQFEQAIQPLNNSGDVGERTGIKNGFAVPMLVDKKEPRIPEFDEVKDKVAQALKQDKAKQQLEQTARQLASSVGMASDLKTAAEKLGLEGQTADAYKLGSPLGTAGTSPAADNAIYNLKAGEVVKEPIKIGDNWVVVGATKRVEADLAEFAKQRESLMQGALQERRGQVFEDYINAVQAKLQSEGRIKIYDDVIARLSDQEEPLAVPRKPQGLPFKR